MKGTGLHQDSSYRPFTPVYTRLDYNPFGYPVGVGLKVAHLGYHQNVCQQIGNAFPFQRRDRHCDHVATPLLDKKVVFCELTLDPLWIGFGTVHLVDSHYQRDASRLDVVDRFDRLGHDPVVGSYYQHSNIGNLGSPGPHNGKCLVAGSIQEGYQVSVGLHLICANMLGDSACLPSHDVAVSDSVQECSLAVVHVAQYGYHRRAGLQLRRVFLIWRDDHRTGSTLLLFWRLDDEAK